MHGLPPSLYGEFRREFQGEDVRLYYPLLLNLSVLVAAVIPLVCRVGALFAQVLAGAVTAVLRAVGVCPSLGFVAGESASKFCVF